MGVEAQCETCGAPPYQHCECAWDDHGLTDAIADKDATIAQLRVALAEACDLAEVIDDDNYDWETWRQRLAACRRHLEPKETT